MKIVSYIHLNEPQFGLVIDGRIMELGPQTDLLTTFKIIGAWSAKSLESGTESVLSNDEVSLIAAMLGPDIVEEHLSVLRERLDAMEIISKSLDKSETLALKDVVFLPPVLNPQKIICVGLNYMDHCLENKVEPPKNPILFAKYASALVGSNRNILKPAITEKLDYEVELAVVIGKKGKKIPENRAYEYVAGYTILNDISARDIQFGDGQWVRGKTADTFAPLGPWLVTQDEIADPHNLLIRCRVNGTLLQDSNTREMIFKIPYLISFISQSLTLMPGDIISTGTPAGVGVFRIPPIFLQPGDVVQAEIEGIGELRNTVVEDR